MHTCVRGEPLERKRRVGGGEGGGEVSDPEGGSHAKKFEK